VLKSAWTGQLLPRAVVIHDAGQVALALQVAQEVRPPGAGLALLSAPGAALWLSPRLFLATVARGAAEAAAPYLPVLDCGDAAGHALAALRAGCPALVLCPACPAFPALSGAAAEAGAQLWSKAPDSLDMAELRADTPYGAGRLRAWLGGDTSAGLR
jgi:hypothetical protein